MDRMSTFLDLIWKFHHKDLWELILHEHKRSFTHFFGMDWTTTFSRNCLIASLGMSSNLFKKLLASKCLDFFSLRSSSAFVFLLFRKFRNDSSKLSIYKTQEKSISRKFGLFSFEFEIKDNFILFWINLPIINLLVHR